MLHFNEVMQVKETLSFESIVAFFTGKLCSMSYSFLSKMFNLFLAIVSDVMSK